MKKRLISFILAAIMTLGVFAFASCNKNEDDNDHVPPTVNPSDSENKGEGSSSKDFEYFDIATEIIENHGLSYITPLVKVTYNELLPDTNFPKIITKDGENTIYARLLLSETCRKILDGAKAEIPESAWLILDIEANILHGYFYDPINEANDPAYDYLSTDIPTSGSTTEIVFYRVPKN